MKKILGIIMALICVLNVSAKDIKTVVLTTNPQMMCENCENKITENLRYVRGIKSIDASAEKQTVTVTYDADKTSVDKIVESLKKINYNATEKACENANASQSAKSCCAMAGKKTSCAGKCDTSSDKQCAKSGSCKKSCEKETGKACYGQDGKTCSKTESK
ncbi:MAG: heavy-metal-associated domain-containing protein [Bacteroidales bacterium]|nr:heavy-metal-associated domain-containing protein [Bacteroidales bacterium]MCM1146342.1 heavy-metal-associated domain-containing protein [Bacteroidales bacterium]MCM1205220.1 heavy-metal-associated domain-containing protein [Bacillota bacterium]MCM1509695.1 heavy-metal-associated domain-containing protein [Clostridium sp.]